jgi:hypothetical protein
MATQAPKKIPLKKKKSAITKWLQQIKKVWKGFGGTFPQKVPPRKTGFYSRKPLQNPPQCCIMKPNSEREECPARNGGKLWIR